MDKATINNLLGTLTALDKNYKDRILVSDRYYMVGDTSISITVGEINSESKLLQVSAKDFKSGLNIVGGDFKLITAEKQIDMISGDTFVTVKESGKLLPIAELTDGEFEYKLELNLGTLLEDYKMLRTSISKDGNKETLRNILLEISDSEVRLVTLDGYRVNVLKYPMSTNANQVTKYIVNTKMFELLSKIKSKSKKVTLSVNKKQAMFEVDDFKVVGNNIDNVYFDYEKVVLMGSKDKIELDKTEVSSITNYLSKIPKNEKFNHVKVVLKGNELEILQDGTQFSSKKVLNLKNVSSGDWTVAFNSDYLLDALKTYEKTGCLVEVRENAEINPMQFIYDNKLTLLLPVRLG